MRYVLNGRLKEYMNKRLMDKTKTKITPTSIDTNKTKHQNKV